MAEIIYITLEQAIDTHHRTITNSGGGEFGQLNVGLLDSVLCNIQNDDYYPSFVEKMTHLFYGACESHSFMDGNKRIALSLCTQFLLLNGYVFIASDFIRKLEDVSYCVAAGTIDKEFLKEIMTAIFNGTYDYDESIKLGIYNALLQVEENKRDLQG